MADFTIRQGELLRPISAVLTDPAAPAGTLEGKTVYFRMRFAGEESYTVNAQARIVDDTRREVAYDWVAGDTDRAGLYEYRWVVVDSGEEQSFPTREQTLEIVGFKAFAEGLPFATAYEAQRYTDAADGVDALKIQLTLEDAADIVSDLTTVPDPMEAEYAKRAKRAELRIFEYLLETGGFVSGRRSITGSSTSYQSNPQIERFVARAMGDYAKSTEEGGGEGGTATVYNITPEPLW